MFDVAENCLDGVNKAMAACDEVRLITRPALNGITDNIVRQLSVARWIELNLALALLILSITCVCWKG